jgi:hypothetical protein
MIERSLLDWWTTRGAAAPRVAPFSIARDAFGDVFVMRKLRGSTLFSSGE